MATFRRFEDITAWQKARETTRSIYLISASGVFAKDFGLRDQLRRASVSVMANIAEGFGRRSDKEFANFLTIARASSAECQSHLYVAMDLGYMTNEEFESLYEAFDECPKMIFGLVRHLRT